MNLRALKRTREALRLLVRAELQAMLATGRPVYVEPIALHRVERRVRTRTSERAKTT